MVSQTTTLCVAAGCGAAVAAYYAVSRARRSGGLLCRKSSPRVLVASQAAAKLKAVEVALGPCTAEGCDVKSYVNDQPVGMEEIMRGAVNRIRQLVDQHLPEGHPYDCAPCPEPL